VTPWTPRSLDVPTLTWRCAALAALSGAALRIPGDVSRELRLARFSAPVLLVAATFAIAWLCQRRDVSRRTGYFAALAAGAFVLLGALAFVFKACWMLFESGDYAIFVVYMGVVLAVAPGLAAIPLVVLSAKLVRRVRALLWPQVVATHSPGQV
jgi:hypothetical protein